MELISGAWWQGAIRWLHLMSGVMWIGHLWYFNFTQSPTMPKIPAELRPGVARYILPEALFWFRWGAMATLVFGLLLAYAQGGFSAWFHYYTFGIGVGSATVSAIGLGMWLGTIMWFNVWFIIWPNQKKVLGITPASDDEKKVAARTASLFSRTNTLLSIPMLYCMAGRFVYIAVS